MKLEKLIGIIGIVLIFIQSLIGTVYAEGNSKEFKFKKSTYSLRGEHDSADINLLLPEGYTMKDVEITSENEKIVRVFDFFDNYFIESFGVGETRLKATIKSTNFVAYCNVKVSEAIGISVSNKNGGATLNIDTYCPYSWSIETKQACEISVTPINSKEEEKWIRLGEGIYGEALNKKYSYDISENCIVTVRLFSWWNREDNKEEYELCRKTIVIDDMEEVSSIGAHINIYANNQNENSSTINVGDTLKLNTEIVEISNDAKITWKIYKENVATVDANGVVTAVGDGTARIEATAIDTGADGQSITYTDVYPVIVQDDTIITIQQLLEKNGAVSGVIPDEVSVGNNKQALINGDELNVSWSSSNNKIATVDENGLIKGISNGKVKISANITYNNSKYEIVKEVNVSGENTENKENKKEETKKDETNNTNKGNNKLQDDTVSKQKLPQTGANNILIFISILGIMLILINIYIKYKSYKNIK